MNSRTTFHDKLRHLMQGFNNRLTLDNPRFIKCYINVKLHILLNFRFGDSSEYVACFQDANILRLYHDSTNVGERLSGMASSPHFEDVCSLSWRRCVRGIESPNCKQKAVLVDVVESMEPPEYFAISSVVWLEGVDSLNRILPKRLYLPSKVGRKVFVGRFADWETSLERRSISGHQDKLISKMVKGAPKIMECVATNADKVIGNLSHIDKVITAFEFVRIGLNLDSIWVGVKESLASGIQIFDVLFGPFDFYEDQSGPVQTGPREHVGNNISRSGTRKGDKDARDC